jgi:hypothetical protein
MPTTSLALLKVRMLGEVGYMALPLRYYVVEIGSE